MSARPGIQSAIYTGTIRHRRFEPTTHDFSYPIFMLYLDLDEVEQVFAKHWFASVEKLNFVSFRRKDFFGSPDQSLKSSVICEVKKCLGQQIEISTVRALLHLRYANYVFNPVVFYYCFDNADEPVAILAEITNTPWGERHHYVLPLSSANVNPEIDHEIKGKRKHQFNFSKAFHVSPFNPMNMDYRWVFSVPDKKLFVHMDNFLRADAEGTDRSEEKTPLNDGRQAINAKHFDATLVMEKKPLDEFFGKTLIQYPFMTVKVVAGIYWQALRLWLKRVPFYDHPNLKAK